MANINKSGSFADSNNVRNKLGETNNKNQIDSNSQGKHSDTSKKSMNSFKRNKNKVVPVSQDIIESKPKPQITQQPFGMNNQFQSMNNSMNENVNNTSNSQNSSANH